MKIFNSKQFYKLDKFHREQLKAFEKDRLAKSLTEEDYFRNRIDKFGIKVIPEKKDTKCKDDGIDFKIIYIGEKYICQLKYWANPLGKKQIKEIYGQMYLSDICMKNRKSGERLNYILLCPFISDSCINMINEYSNEDYYIVYGEKFVEFLINPISFMQKKLYKKEG